MTRKPLSIRSLLLLTISTLMLLIATFASMEAYRNWRQFTQIQSLAQALLLGDQLFDAAEKFAEERDIAFTMLHAHDKETTSSLAPRLQTSRQLADDAVHAVLQGFNEYAFPELVDLQTQLETQQTRMKVMRQQIDEVIALPISERDPRLSANWFDEQMKLIVQIQALWTQFIAHFTGIDPVVTQHLRIKHLLRIISDYNGRERALIGRLIVENTHPNPAERARLLQDLGVIELSWRIANMLSDHSGLFPAIKPYFVDAQSHYLTMQDMVVGFFTTANLSSNTVYPIGPDLWFELSTQMNESLDALRGAVRKGADEHVTMLAAKAGRAITINLFVLLLAFALCGYSFYIVTQRVLRPISQMVEALLNTSMGKPSKFTPPARQQDEIGKLAHVLYEFQRNTEEIKRYTKALEHSNKELDDFAYIASHDLKEPLRGIHNHSRFLLEDNQDKLDEESTNRLNRLVYLSQRMERLVNDLLYFSRLGRQDLAIKPTDLAEAIEDIVETLDVFLTEHHARVTMPKPLPTIVCDKVRVTEALRNLIVNGIKYNQNADKIVEIGFLAAHPAPSGIMMNNVFYVKDNGKGIAPEFHQEIFRIFKRLETSKNAKEDGTGVGLTFVKKIIERHGGEIWLDSEPEKGTTFYFTLERQPYDTKSYS